jgi:hypothetical protein
MVKKDRSLFHVSMEGRRISENPHGAFILHMTSSNENVPKRN